jgi:hypothetical protein
MSNVLAVYTTPPNMEFRAAGEQKRLGIEAIVPPDYRERVSRKGKRFLQLVPAARGYVFTGYKHAMSRHMREYIGPVTRDELDPLFCDKPKQPTSKFSKDDKVTTQVGCFAEMVGKVIKETKKGYLVEFPMFGTTCTVFIPERQLAHYVHPG